MSDRAGFCAFYYAQTGQAAVWIRDEKRFMFSNTELAWQSWQAAQAQAGDGEPEAAQDKVIAGALFDFLGFLTTRDKPTAFGATRNASPAVELLKEWADKRGLDLEDADVENFHSRPAKGE